MSQTQSTIVSVFEYNGNVATGTVTPAVDVDPQAIWDSCVYALGAMVITGQSGQGYKSAQTKKSPASPGHWSDPGNNIGALAANTKWKSGLAGQPHIHLGNSQKRAVIGCALTPGTGQKYQSMNIYIGEEG